MHVQFVYVNIFGGEWEQAVIENASSYSWAADSGCVSPSFFLPFSALEEWAKGRRVGGLSSEWPNLSLQTRELHRHCSFLFWHSCVVTFWSVLIAYEFQNWQNLQKNEDNPSSLAACQELAILHNPQLQMLFSDIYMQILEENENEKQRENGNAAIYICIKEKQQVNSRHLDLDVSL